MQKPYERDFIYVENNYPKYQRRPPAPNSEELTKNPDAYSREVDYRDKKGKVFHITSANIVPYNPFLSSKYRAQ